VYLALLLTVLPQILRIVINSIYAYEIEGNIAYGIVVDALCIYSADILGKLAFFSSFGIAVYLSFTNGMKRGGEWFLGLIGMYFVAYVLLIAVNDYLFGITAYLICAALSLFAFLFWTKKNRGTIIVICLGLFLSIIGGVISLFASEAPSLTMILYSCFYGFANYGFELLLIIGACRLCVLLTGAFAHKKRSELDVAGKLISFKNPVMLSLFSVLTLFVLISAVSPTINVIESIIEYGPPVNAEEWYSIFKIYAELLLIFLIGYIAMRFSAGRVESAYYASMEGKD
jgi:hypothetical protein